MLVGQRAKYRGEAKNGGEEGEGKITRRAHRIGTKGEEWERARGRGATGLKKRGMAKKKRKGGEKLETDIEGNLPSNEVPEHERGERQLPGDKQRGKPRFCSASGGRKPKCKAKKRNEKKRRFVKWLHFFNRRVGTDGIRGGKKGGEKKKNTRERDDNRKGPKEEKIDSREKQKNLQVRRGKRLG